MILSSSKNCKNLWQQYIPNLPHSMAKTTLHPPKKVFKKKKKNLLLFLNLSFFTPSVFWEKQAPQASPQLAALPGVQVRTRSAKPGTRPPLASAQRHFAPFSSTCHERISVGDRLESRGFLRMRFPPQKGAFWREVIFF